MNEIAFEDDNLTYDIDRAEKIFTGLIKRKMGIKWYTPNGVAAWRLNTHLVRLMKDSGCAELIARLLAK